MQRMGAGACVVSRGVLIKLTVYKGMEVKNGPVLSERKIKHENRSDYT